jgi:NAD(P)-dependent dehydrogenase (short-subunit alcohol dehydrogenase family)/acyl carrier protein
MDSRTSVFADEIMQLTDGQGVDVVLNSLAGEALTKSFQILAHHGRFLELGKKDIHLNSQLNLAPFEQNITFAAIDLSLLLRERPKLMMKLWREIMAQFEKRQLHPLPTTLFQLEETVDALRFLAQAKQIGKVAISFEGSEKQSLDTALDNGLFTDQSTYLITGGLGGLGLTIVQWMVVQGARHFVLVGRSGASATAMETLAILRRENVDVVVIQADITQEQQVATMLAQIKVSMPPLGGIIHAAAVLNDGILLQTNHERLRTVMAPKIKGAWNLHTLTKSIPLDFFVLFSSTASLIGLPGQGNYSAANAFLDALAHQRRLEGLPALSINWGAWADIGLAAAQSNRGERLALRGIKNLTPQQGLDMLMLLLSSPKEQVGAMPFDVVQWQQFYPSVRFSAMFDTLLRQKRKDIVPGDGQSVKQKVTPDALLAYDLAKREQVVQTLLCEHMAHILKLPIAKLNIARPIHTLGIDSLMAVELKNQIEADLSVTVPVVLLLQGTTPAQLATYLLNELEKRAMPDDALSYSDAGN